MLLPEENKLGVLQYLRENVNLFWTKDQIFPFCTKIQNDARCTLAEQSK